jgi:glycosyltransferase involved in cell wall biosynthesis
MNADVLKDYRIKVYSVQSADVVMAGRLLSGRTDLAVEFLAPCSHNEMLRRHGQARVSIGLSIGDAISTSLLEAMLMGTFPIQSNTSAWNEWVENGKTALIVPPDDPCAVAGAIRRAVADDALVDGASRLNWETAVARLDEKAIRPRVIGMYEEVLLARRKS